MLHCLLQSVQSRVGLLLCCRGACAIGSRLVAKPLVMLCYVRLGYVIGSRLVAKPLARGAAMGRRAHGRSGDGPGHPADEKSVGLPSGAVSASSSAISSALSAHLG